MNQKQAKIEGKRLEKIVNIKTAPLTAQQSKRWFKRKISSQGQILHQKRKKRQKVEEHVEELCQSLKEQKRNENVFEVQKVR